MICAFDFDGTLADSRLIYYCAVEEYAKRQGLPLPSQAQMDLVFGDPQPEIVFEGWNHSKDDSQRRERLAYQMVWAGENPFRAHLGNVYALTDDLICEQPGDMPLYEGIFDLLKSLHEEGARLAIVTSRSRKPVEVLMAHHGIREFFQSVWTGTEVEEGRCRGKPYPDKLHCALKELDPNYNIETPSSDVFMVGDTHMDIKMAREVGVRALGVGWGYHQPEVLRSYGAEAIAIHPNQLREFLV